MFCKSFSKQLSEAFFSDLMKCPLLKDVRVIDVFFSSKWVNTFTDLKNLCPKLRLDLFYSCKYCIYLYRVLK